MEVCSSSWQGCALKGLFFINSKGIITSYDAVVEKWLSVPREKALYRSFWEVFEDQLFGFSMRQALQDKKIAEIRLMPPLLSSLKVEAFFMAAEEHPSAYAHPMPEGVILVLCPLTDAQRLQALVARKSQLQELNRMAALVAHEIRNPLGGIKGFASLLQRDLKDQSDLYKLATYIVEGTESLSRLVNQILDYTKPLHLSLTPHNLVPFMEGLLLHLNADDSIDPRIELHFETNQTEIWAAVDLDHLKLALLNLTANAIQAMPKGGEIRLQLSTHEKEVFIRISDTGVGIPVENAAKIFSPFFTTRKEGHGFGLMEVHKIIEAHHGEIAFISHVGQGTIFIIRLPEVLQPRVSMATS